jgi:hypothetical protein
VSTVPVVRCENRTVTRGGGSPGNVLLLCNIDEMVDYEAAYTAGKGASVAAAVLAGPGTNAVLYLLVRFAPQRSLWCSVTARVSLTSAPQTSWAGASR